MKQENIDLILSCWKEIVQKIDFRRIATEMINDDPEIKNLIADVPWEDNLRHYHRLVLFRFIRETTPDDYLFKLSEGIRKGGFPHIADKIIGKRPTPQPRTYNDENATGYSSGEIKHKTNCFRPADDPPPTLRSQDTESLKIEVTPSTRFYDDHPDSYRVRSKNRGRVLIINNIHFGRRYDEREGAIVDEHNLKLLFVRMGMEVDMHRDLTALEIMQQTEKFVTHDLGDNPDICFAIVMSHGERRDNQTVIVGSDGTAITEEAIKMRFSNQDCVLFRNKPKVLIFHVCRGKYLDELAINKLRTQYDSACAKGPDRIEDRRLYSDMLICHPSLEGYQAHRDVLQGCWYIELLCRVFMEYAHNTDIETMLKKIDRGLENRMSESGTQQTSTFTNIGFKNCFLHPGVYEENGKLKKIDTVI